MAANKKSKSTSKANGVAAQSAVPADVEGVVLDEPGTISIAENLRGKHILMSGGSGFLGKVVVSLLLHRHPDIGQLYLLLRKSRYDSVKERFIVELAESPALEPLQKVYTTGLMEFLDKKVTVYEGDVTQDLLGLKKRTYNSLCKKLDLVLSCAGLVAFSPTLTEAFDTNVHGPLRMAQLAADCKNAAFSHVSTCYVCGRFDGEISEEVEVGFYPRAEELHISFDPERELNDCNELISSVHRRADDQERKALFTRLTRESLKADNRNPDLEENFEPEYNRQRDKWIAQQLRDEGARRADHWGWSNTYTYSKSLCEQLITTRYASEMPVSIIRPAIVESAYDYPIPGWNQGVTTTAGLSYLMYKGIRFIPTRKEGKLDVIPVDLVANGILAACAFLLAGEADYVYQLGSSEENPLSMFRAVELTTLANRQSYLKRVGTPKWQNILMTALDSVPVDKKRYERFSAPGVRRYAQQVSGLARTTGSSVPALKGLTRAIDGTAQKIAKQSKLAETVFDIFMPFIHDCLFTFRTANMRKLQQRLPAHEKSWGFLPQSFEWRNYWLDIHSVGLHRYLFPELEEMMAAERKSKKPYTYHDLVEMFEASGRNHTRRVALQRLTPAGIERYTYGELRAYALRIAESLRSRGLGDGDRVLIASENRPEWGMSYFGVLEAKGTAVPIDAELSLRQIENLARSCEAFAIILSDDVRKRLESEGLGADSDVIDVGDENGWTFSDVELLGFEELMDNRRPLDDAETTVMTVARPWATNDVASLIYTSGTTGQPKGVMLSHGNFTSLLASVNRVFRVSDKDSFLSVLPLHHTFEFTAGFLMPLSRGATITYLDELSSESLQRAFRETRVTAILGVPALWQLLHRRIVGGISERGPMARVLFDSLVSLNRWLRDGFRINPGKLLFSPIHRRFGGRIRYLISGGASLPAPIMETFHGLGFDLMEGYGLTEAAPVLTVGRPGDPVKVGSVGRALPGVEVEILDPDNTGVGEIIARGGNVMLGYWNNEDATKQVITEDGWLKTGDLGSLDKKGYLYIAGRQKEVIVSASGENVYPDELEEHFEGGEGIEELSVVGVPDGDGSERVAMMVRPTEAAIEEHGFEDACHLARKHIDVQNARLAHHHRVKIVRYTREPLPRTATRKIKRKEVTAMLAEMQTATRSDQDSTDWGSWTWLRDEAARLVDIDPATLSPESSLADDLGYDSLTVVELAAAIDKRRGKKVSSDDLIAAATLEGIIALLESTPAVEQIDVEDTGSPGYHHLPPQMRPQGARRPERPGTQLGEILEVPEPARQTLKGVLGQAQSVLYGDVFDVRVAGKAHIPWNDNAIVCANHCSHLDMGLVKYALRHWAPNLATLAASDYFFDTKAKRTYFGQFTNLIPVERTGGLEQSMGTAVEAVKKGQPILLFPEGTRSVTGQIADFRQGLGYMVMSTRTGVLPVYLGGTYRALPKGSVVPKNRRLRVSIGERIPFSYFEEKTDGMAFKDACTEVSRLCREAVKALKAGRRFLDEDRETDGGDQARLIAELFEQLKARFVLGQVDTNVSYYFSLGNDDSDKWTISVDRDECRVQPGKPSNGRADCVIKTSPDMFRKMVRESYIPSIDEFMSGKIKTNDPSLLMTFQNVFGF